MSDTRTPLTYSNITVRPYAGWHDLAGTARLLAWCVVGALFAAVPAAVALFAGSGGWIMVAGLTQGFVLSFALRQAFRRMGVRQAGVMYAAVIGSTLVSIGFVQFALYLHDVWFIAVYLAHLRGDAAWAEMLKGQAFRLQSHAFNGHTPFGPFVNNVLWHMQNPAFVTISLVHLFVTGFEARLAVTWARRSSFCDACGGTLADPTNLLVLPANRAARLADAVRIGNVAEAFELSAIGATAALGSACVVARLLRCPACGTDSVDVVSKVFSGMSHRLTRLNPATATDKPFVDALRSTPVLPTAADAAIDPAAAPPA